MVADLVSATDVSIAVAHSLLAGLGKPYGSFWERAGLARTAASICRQEIIRGQ